MTPAAPTPAEGPVVDEALAPGFVAGIRHDWELAERIVGDTAPDLGDDEIVVVGAAMCDYIAAHPWIVDIDPRDPGETMPAFSEVAAVTAEALGIDYDPTMQDAGFDNGFEARLVAAFGDVAYLPRFGGLCPAGVALFHSPWSVRASE